VNRGRETGDEAMNTHERPTIGAAMPVAQLEAYAAWLIEGRRDLEIQDAFQPETLDGDWQPVLERARGLLDGHQGRLGIHGPFDGLTLMSRDPQVRGLVSQRLCTGLELAAALGATHMVVHSPFQFFGSPWVPHAAGTGRSEQIALVHATLEKVVPFAEAINCTLMIENILDRHPQPLLELIRSFDSPHVQMSLDTGHALITHRLGGPPPDQWVREAGTLLGHLHVQDTDGHGDRHWAPGDGELNWFALFEALRELPHRPRLLLELRQPQDIRRAADWLVHHGFAR